MKIKRQALFAYINKKFINLIFNIIFWLSGRLSNIFFRNLKKTVRYKHRTFCIINAKLRIASKVYLHFGDDKNIDKIYDIITCQFLGEPISEANTEYLALSTETIEKTKKDIPDDLWQSLEKEKEQYKNLKDIITRAQDTVKITDSDFWVEYTKRNTAKSQILKEMSHKNIKKLFCEIDKEFNKCKESIGDHKRIKLSFNKETINIFLQVATPLFLFIGFIYNNVYYSYLGIKIANYATLTDYISTSFDKVSLIIIGACIHLLSFFWGLSHGSSLPNQVVPSSTRRSDIMMLIIVLNIVGILGLTFIYPSTSSALIRIDIIQALVLIISTYVIWEHIWKYFDNPKKPVFCLMFISATLIVTIGDAVKDAISAIKNKPNLEYIRSDEKPIPDTYFFAGSNSGYFFFIKDNDNSLIIPSGDIKEIRTPQ